MAVFAAPASAQSVREKPVPALKGSTNNFAVPFDYAPPLRPFIVVHARINGSEPMPFIINTGRNSELMIFPAAAKKAGLKPRATDAKAKPAPGTPLAIGGSKLTLLGRGKETYSLDTAQTYLMERPALLKDYGTTEIAGMIGARFLLSHSSRLDFNTRTWTLYGPGPIPRPVGKNKVWAVPLAKDSDLPMATISARDKDGKVIAERAAYLHTAQTGNGLLVTQPDTFSDLPYAEGDFARMGPTGMDAVQVVLLPSLAVGDAPLSNVELSLSPAFARAYVGLDVLERFRVTISAPDRMLYLEERPSLPHPLLGRTGITLDQRAPGSYYCLTAPPPPETKNNNNSAAPVRVGDRLLAVDGRDITGMPFWRADMLLNSYAGTSARLKVQTDNEPPRTVIVPRRNRFKSKFRLGAEVIFSTTIQQHPSASRHEQ